jgi:hypothetical protein
MVLDTLSKYISIKIARNVENLPIFRLMFLSTISFAKNPLPSRSPSSNWCEVWYYLTDCYFPFSQGICKNCRPDTPCPELYRVSYAYNYATTGCWCVAISETVNRVCCDCTPAWNNPYIRNELDCQCTHDLV